MVSRISRSNEYMKNLLNQDILIPTNKITLHFTKLSTYIA